jgi:pimeloyl-ACP methyl ester carboxylesterase
MLNYRHHGSGPPLVLQHGFLGGSGYWVPHFAILGRHFEVIAPDLPGFAGSADAEVPDSVEGFAVALLGLLDELAVGRTALLGHSMGSMVALQIALDYPERIERLVLYGSACTGTLPKRFETTEASIARLEEQGVEACADHIVPTWFVDGESAPFFAMCREAGRGARTEAAIRALGALARWNVCERLSELRMPVLAICGDRDRSTSPDQSYRLWEGIPDCQLCSVPGCAHNVHLERPELFSSIVLDFLTSI